MAGGHRQMLGSRTTARQSELAVPLHIALSDTCLALPIKFDDRFQV